MNPQWEYIKLLTDFGKWIDKANTSVNTMSETQLEDFSLLCDPDEEDNDKTTWAKTILWKITLVEQAGRANGLLKQKE